MSVLNSATEFALGYVCRPLPWTGPEPAATILNVTVGAVEVVEVVISPVVVVMSVVADEDVSVAVEEVDISTED